MLQQTQVERVIPRYRQFLERFPSFQELAAAPRAEVIRRWAPLGYNRRAVRLHEIARRVVAEFDGSLPTSASALRSFDGLGAYSAGAVACFAFGQQVAVLDTNVRRVLGRLFAADLATLSPSPRGLSQLADEILPPGRAADWNQALMDFGATICTARAPSCERCPLAEACQSRAACSDERLTPVRRAAEGRAAYRTAPPFLHSSRYYRGRIVDYLRQQPADRCVGLDEIGRAIRPDYVRPDRAWLAGLIDGLAKDDLLVWRERGEGSASGGLVALP
jgi:A/G-specific adenine glycosylase